MSREIEIHGLCEDKFQVVKTAFAKNFKVDGDIGASFAATINGKFVIDIWGGYADKERTRPWEKDTIVNVYSTTKAMAIISALILVDRGELDLDAPVAKYWPEFAQNGKEDLPVRNIFSHTSGLAGWEEKIVPEDLFNWEKAVSLLAAQKPWWEPGTKSGYHAITHGYLLGELVRRITHKSLGTFFKEEIADPLNADFHIGFGEELDHRVADLIPYRQPQPGDQDYVKIDPYSVFSRVFSNPVLDPSITKTRAWRAAEIPAAGGHGNARSVARIASAIACGGKVDGVCLLSKKTIELAMEEQSYGQDLVLMYPVRFGLGFGLPSKEMPLPNPNSLYWGGAGGSVIIMDLDKKISLSYVMNKMRMTTSGDTRSARLIAALYGSLGK